MTKKYSLSNSTTPYMKSGAADVLFLIAALSAPFLAVLDTFIFNVAVPSIQNNFHASSAAVQLIISAYILSYVAFLVTGGRLGDTYGRKKLFTLGILFFCFTSILGALSQNAIELIGVRFLQGIAGALMYPQALSLIQVRFDAQARARALSFFGATLGLALIAGQLIGGLLIQINVLNLSWRPIFLVNLPLGLFALIMGHRYIEESKASVSLKIDHLGVALLTVGLMSLVFFLTMGRETGWPGWLLPCLFLGVAAVVLFVWHERKLSKLDRSPLLHLDLLKIRSLVIGMLSTMFFYAAQVSFTLLLTLYLQRELKLSPLTAGSTFAVVAVGFLGASLVSPQLLKRIGKHTLLLGMGLSAAATYVLGLLVLNRGANLYGFNLLLLLLIVGIGYGLVIPSLIGVVLKKVPQQYAGAASGLLVSAQQLAGIIGVTIVGIPFFNALGSDSHIVHYGVAYSSTLHCNIGLLISSGVMLVFIRD